MENELKNKIEELELQVQEMQELLYEHKHTLFDNTKRIVYSLPDAQKISFPGISGDFEIYRQVGDNGELRIDSGTDQEGKIRIGGSKRPLSIYIYGGDEGLLGADNNTNDSYLLVEPGKAGFFTDKGNDFYFRLPNGSADPSTTLTGAMAVVSGKLKIYDGSNWVVVGGQT